MRRITRVSIVAAIVMVALLCAVPTWAASQPQGDALSDAEVQQVRQNCTQAQSVLQRLQATDVATRINRGRIYENLLNNLITPFDNRVALNQFDASSLTATANNINQKFSAFKTDYSSYEDSFSQLLSLKCQNNPRGFYNLLSTTRDGRTKVASDIVDLNTLIGQYTTAFNQLKSAVEAN